MGEVHAVAQVTGVRGQEAVAYDPGLALLQVVPLVVFSEESGGLRAEGNALAAVTSSGRVLERIRLSEGWQDEVDDYRICRRFQTTTWCIGKPFDHLVRFTVDWKQNGYECAGELVIPQLSKLPFSWEAVVSHNGALFAQLPDYVFDVAFPWSKLHDARDIVLRRRLAAIVRERVCAGAGAFKVSRHDTWEVQVNNFFEGVPDVDNATMPLATCWPDVLTARKQGLTRY